MHRLVLTLLALLLVLAPGVPAAPQQTFRGGTRIVEVYATVTNRDNRLVPDLQQGHFEVYDNGQRREIAFFRNDILPITAVVMLDMSGSMTLHLDVLKDAAEQFILRLLPLDRAKVGAFSDKIQVLPRETFTPNRDELVRIIREDLQYGGGTRLWDAVNDGMSHLTEQPGRKVVLVFSDGGDTESRHVDFDRVIERARDEQFLIYSIGLQSVFMGQVTRPERKLRRLAEETGGGYFELKTAKDLGSTFTQIANELHRQYVIGFSPAVLDGKVHQLDVRSVIPGMVVRARKSYLAKPD